MTLFWISDSMSFQCMLCIHYIVLAPYWNPKVELTRKKYHYEHDLVTNLFYYFA